MTDTPDRVPYQNTDALTENERRFTYHPPKDDQPHRYELLRNEGRMLANAITNECPPGRERSLALTKLQEAIMWANAAIACNE